jgi:8-oxo-dGTP pyrophosphatase MutT (NUDIX family)
MTRLLKMALESRKPFRKAVRVIIRKGDKIILGKRIQDATGELLSYDFIGGGVDEGESMEDAVLKECLEEVGIRVKNIQKLSVTSQLEHTFSKPERTAMYAGTEDHYFVADFDKFDKRLHGSEGDAMPHEYVTVDEAIHLIKHAPESDFNPIRLTALDEIKHLH